MLLEQVLTNLLENAAKYTPPGSPIRIDTEVSAEGVVVSVSDRGPGVPPADLERIFEKFHRLPGEGSAGGTGLGLAICRAILTAHGGRIWAENLAGGGASFRFFLPIVGPSPAIDESAA